MSDPVRELKRQLLAAGERQHAPAAVHAGRGRVRPHRGRNRLVLASATLLIAAAATLLSIAPWNSSPSFLARAEAALTPPAGTVLHMQWEMTSTWTRPFCRVIRGQGEVWIDGAPPHRYRVLLNDLSDPNADPREPACSRGTSEYGGTYRSMQTLRFVPPNTLSVTQLRFRFELDPAAALREAISTGRAHDEGKTQLDGRTVERILIDPPSACPRLAANCPREPIYVYVDPETFYPVETVATLYQVEIVGGPETSLKTLHVRVRDVMRYLTFEYLPRTAANLALTDIRAQHPTATGPQPLGVGADD